MPHEISPITTVPLAPVPEVRRADSTAAPAAARLVFASGGTPLVLHTGEPSDTEGAALSTLRWRPTAEAVARLVADDGTLLLVAGLGDHSDDPHAWRLAAGAATRSLSDVPSLAVVVPPDTDPAFALAAVEGAALGAYRFTPYRSKPAETLASLTVTHPGVTDADLAELAVTLTAVAQVRDLVNLPAAEITPERAAALAAGLGAAAGLDITVWDLAALRRDGFGGIVAVGQGSDHEPRLVKMTYAPAGASGHLALVGKGITFDSGGLSLKTGNGMVGMKADMAGAATALATVVALARLAVPLRVTAWLCFAENLPSGHATRPNDVIRHHGGTTVEVVNTDAEGRLVLADALHAASLEAPDAIIDIATLTGAQITALGARTAGLMGHGPIIAQVEEAAAWTGDPVWPMPLPDYLIQTLRSEVADLANATYTAGQPGMLLAGRFLREFVGDRDGVAIPWAHLDIAGPAFLTGSGWGFTSPGATGMPVRTLIRLGQQFSAG